MNQICTLQTRHVRVEWDPDGRCLLTGSRPGGLSATGRVKKTNKQRKTVLFRFKRVLYTVYSLNSVSASVLLFCESVQRTIRWPVSVETEKDEEGWSPDYRKEVKIFHSWWRGRLFPCRRQMLRPPPQGPPFHSKPWTDCHQYSVLLRPFSSREPARSAFTISLLVIERPQLFVFLIFPFINSSLISV